MRDTNSIWKKKDEQWVEIRRQQMSDKKKQKLEEEAKRKEQKAKEEENRRKRRSEQKDEEDMLTAESKQRIILQGSGNLLKEAESRLSEAILLADMDKISIAHGLLEVARQRMDSATTSLADIAVKRKACFDKKKSERNGESSADKTKKQKKH